VKLKKPVGRESAAAVDNHRKMGVAMQYEPSWWLAAVAAEEAADELFEGRLRDAVLESARAGAPCSLVMLDAGSERAAVERALMSAGLDACFTVGARRFAVVLASCDTRAATALARTFVPLGTRAIGVATGTPDRPFSDELYASAHVAMVEAERAADRRIVVFGEASAAPTPLDALESEVRLLALLTGLDRLVSRAPAPARARLRCIVGEALADELVGERARPVLRVVR
jgi:hypothetical protein